MFSSGPVRAPSSTASSLIQSIKDDDPVGWEQLVTLYSGLVYAWCRQAGLSSEDAADIVQEVFRSIHRGIGAFEKQSFQGSFRGWLKVITANKIRDFLRRTARRPKSAGGSDVAAALQQVAICDPVSSCETNSRWQTGFLDQALASVKSEFEPRTWGACWLMVVEERTAAEVAHQLDMTTGAVHTARWRVLRRLREFLQDVFD